MTTTILADTTTIVTTNVATTTDVSEETTVISAPTLQPTLQITQEEEDWSQLQQDGEGSSEEEEDWSQIGKAQNLYCGTSQFDAIRNCGSISMKC